MALKNNMVTLQNYAPIKVNAPFYTGDSGLAAAEATTQQKVVMVKVTPPDWVFEMAAMAVIAAFVVVMMKLEGKKA